MPPITVANVGCRSTNYCAGSRALLAPLGILGEIVPTPGHSEDSVSLVLVSGWAFTGDLTLERMIGPEDRDKVLASWRLLRERKATMIYAGHAPPFPMPAALP